jgi:hypothetical protein
MCANFKLIVIFALIALTTVSREIIIKTKSLKFQAFLAVNVHGILQATTSIVPTRSK